MLSCWKSGPQRRIENTGRPSCCSHGHCRRSGRGLLCPAHLANTASVFHSHDLFQQGKWLSLSLPWGKISVKVPEFSVGQNLLLSTLLPQAQSRSALPGGGGQGVKAVPCQQWKGRASAMTGKVGWKQKPQTQSDRECQNAISKAYLGSLIKTDNCAWTLPGCAQHRSPPGLPPPCYTELKPAPKGLIMHEEVSLLWGISH